VSRLARLAAAALGVAYLASRLHALTALPMFLDETTHIRWAVEIAEGEKLGRPWNYGKGVSIFLNALLFPWAFDHYLWASRALTVAFGALSLGAGSLIARRLFDSATAAVFAVLYVACPFALFYDRLALTDPPMAAFATLALLSSVRLSEEPRARNAVLLALALVLAVLTKATALLVALTPLLALLVLRPPDRQRVKMFGSALLLSAAVLFWPLLHFFATTATVRLGLEHREATLATRLATNLPLAASWLGAYLTWPVVLFLVVGFSLSMSKRWRPGLLLAMLVAGPCLAFSAVSTLWFPRYLVFLIVPALILAAHGFVALTSPLPPLARAALLPLALVPAFGLDRDMLVNPANAAIAEADRDQFVQGWPSGYGTEGTVAFVREELRHHPSGLTVVVHVHSRRTTWLALGLEFAREPRVELRDLDLTRAENLDLLAAWAHARPTLLVVSPVGPAHRRPEPLTWGHLGQLVLRSCKPDGGKCDAIYRLDTARRPAS
jgi:hypothetical protein